MDQRTGVDPGRVAQLYGRELARFEREHPRCLELRDRARPVMPHGVPMQWMAASFAHPVWVTEGHGAHFTCADGRDFLDTNIGDKSTFCGFDPEPVVRAVQARVAAGPQFMLPTEDAIVVAEELGRRWGLPSWQFTLSASQANTEALRLARHATGRERVLMFAGDYAGHVDEFFVPYGADGRLSFSGLKADVGRDVGVVQLNDVAALERALATGAYACVLTEPALTNSGVVLPDPGFHDALRRLTREHGTLLILDETHTLICGPGGLVGCWGLEPDVVTAGKAIGGGVPLGVYGMTRELAEAFERDEAPDGREAELASGGTLFGNALSMAAARAALLEVLTDEAYERTARLGAMLAEGMERIIAEAGSSSAAADPKGGAGGGAAEAGLPWKVQRLYARSGLSFCGRLPRSAGEWDEDEQPALNALLRLYLANRGIWEAIETAGPAMSVAATEDDVSLYLTAFAEFVADVTTA